MKLNNLRIFVILTSWHSSLPVLISVLNDAVVLVQTPHESETNNKQKRNKSTAAKQKNQQFKIINTYALQAYTSDIVYSYSHLIW